MIKISEMSSLDKHYTDNAVGFGVPESIKPQDAIPFVNVRPEFVDSGDGFIPTGNDVSENYKTSVIGLLSIYDEKNRTRKYTRFDEVSAGEPHFYVDQATKELCNRLGQLHLIDGTQVTVGKLSYDIVGVANQFQDNDYKVSGNRYMSLVGGFGYLRFIASLHTNIGGGIGSNLLLNFGFGTFFTGDIVGGGTLTPSDTADEFGFVLNVRNNTWWVDWAVPLSFTGDPTLPTSGTYDTGITAYAFQMMGFELLGSSNDSSQILKIIVGDVLSPRVIYVLESELLDGFFYSNPFETPEFYQDKPQSLDFFKMAYMFFQYIAQVGGFTNSQNNNLAFGLSRLNVPVNDITVLYPQYVNGLGQGADFGYGTYLYDMYFERYDPQNDYAQQSIVMFGRNELQRLDEHVANGGNDSGGAVLP